MSMTRQTILASRPAAMVLALSLVAGLSAPFVMLPKVHAADAPVVPSSTPAGITELSPAPVNQVTAVPPNIVVTFDDSGSMAWDYLGDHRPFDNGSWSGPWECAGVIDPDAAAGIDSHVMNGVYYNPNVPYTPPVKADGGSFKNADDTLKAVWDDGIRANRALDPGGSGNTTDFTGTKGWYSDNRWTCPADEGTRHHPGTSPIADGGPYYYEYDGPTIEVDKYGNPTSAGLDDLYDKDNWKAVAVPADQYQNWANWWAYYRTRNLMARTALSRVFGAPGLAATNKEGGFGTEVRVAWQNINDSTFMLQASQPASGSRWNPTPAVDGAIISALTDTNPSDCNAGGTPPALGSQLFQPGSDARTPPDCYRSDFFNWIFQVPANGGTPLRSALTRAGDFFMRGDGNTGVTGDLHDPYWQPPQTGDYNATSNPGNELYCRQNFSILITDGLWNDNTDGPKYSTLTLPTSAAALPDGVTPPSPGGGNVTSIFAPKHNGQYGYTSYASLSDVAYNYWATNLRPDLYQGGIGAPDKGHIVPAYLPDTYTGLFPSAGDVTVPFPTGTNPDGTPNYSLSAEVYFNPKNDPATWPHMADYMIGLGVTGVMNFSENTDCKGTTAVDLDACDLRKGDKNSTGSVGWPTPASAGGSGITENIDDTWHAALAGRGQFFSAGNPQQLVDQLTSILTNIAARASTPQPGAVNSSVATVGALSFNTGYNADWSGVFQAVILNPNGTIGSTVWDAGSLLDSRAASDRNIYTDAMDSGTFSSFDFTAANAGSLDAVESALLMTPASTGDNDTAGNRIDYLRGDQTHEADGTFRKRAHLLGAIIHSQPVYVGYPSSGYYNNWPSGSAEATAAAASNGTDDKSYDSFVADHANRAPTVYVGANDGMLHAFNAPLPSCTSYDPATGQCAHYDYGTDPGKEEWAFVPRAVYANLGNLTSANDFKFRPTVDATPVTRDVFFSSDSKWHTILASGVGVGGRGVFALDITGNAAPNADTPMTKPNKVLWELDSDMTIPGTCVSIMGSGSDSSPNAGCHASDLGYTVSQPNIGRLQANGEWVVIMPNGYFPDCSKGDIPTADKASCLAVAAEAPSTDPGKADGKPYSALFVMDAETGTVIAELKTPTDIDGVTSYGLATPVMGDYNNDQVDDVAFAGDLQGNLWRFDLSGTSASSWTVTLVYKGLADADGNQGLQPITTMPRLFPDPATNRFMVVFGTGRYLGAADNGTTQTQAIMGVRDVVGKTWSQTDLTRDYLHETDKTLTDGTKATVRCVTGKPNDTCDAATASQVNPIPAPDKTGGGGWRIDLYTTTADGTQNNVGEQVVVSPGAIFASNTVVFETLLTGSSGSDPCNPATQGAVMAFNADTGAPAGVSSLGGWPIVGARVSNARTSGSLPIVSALGGGQAYLPGLTLGNSKTPMAIDAPIWRRRSWQEINQYQ